MTYDDGLAKLLQGDALDVLAEMPERSVDCAVTSPPYWGLRLYSGEQERVWGDGWRGNFGQEPSVALYIAHLMEFMRAIKRVLKDTGVAWINLGDSMDTLNLAGVPQRFFTACQDDGWIVRSEIILAKYSPMPESLRGWFWARCRVKTGYIPGTSTAFRSGNYRDQDDLPDNSANKNEHKDLVKWADCPGCPRCIPNGGLVLRKGSWRPTSSHEKLFMLTKGDGYFSDGEDVREGLSPATLADKRNDTGRHTYASSKWDQMEGNKPSWYRAKTFVNPETGRNLRDVWPMKSSAFTMQLCKACKRVYTGAQFGRLHGESKKCSCGASDWLSHFAAFHPSLPTTCILASTSPRGNCSKCGMPFVRVIERGTLIPLRGNSKAYQKAGAGQDVRAKAYQDGGWTPGIYESKTLAWLPSCSCPDPTPEPALILDPFNGTASTGVAAKRLGRRYIGIDLSEDYLLLSGARLAAETAGMI